VTRFLLDAMLGSLATYLRMCGHDAAYALDRGIERDDAVASLAREENRTLLTRDRELARRVDDAVLLTHRDVREQLAELRAAGVDVTLPEQPRRCGVCNSRLERVPGDASTPAYAPDSVSTPVWRCTECGQYFWKGSHWDDVRERLADI
jgi:uncharacterized protein with PIN domain